MRKAPAEAVPRDNHEGLAIVPEAVGATLWLIWDDNQAPYQWTLLLELKWRSPPAAAARHATDLSLRPPRPS